MQQIGRTKSLFYAFILVLILIVSVSEPGLASSDALNGTSTVALATHSEKSVASFIK